MPKLYSHFIFSILNDTLSPLSLYFSHITFTFLNTSMRQTSALCKAFSVLYTPAESDVSKQLKLSKSHLKEFPVADATQLWTSLNMARGHFKELIETTPHSPLVSIRSTSNLRKQRGSTIEGWSTGMFESIESIAMFYERAISPAAKLTKEIEDLQLESHGLKDILRLKRLPASQLEAKKKRLNVVLEELTRLFKERAAYVESAFTTQIYNALINIFRLCGEADPHAHRYAVQLLDDMSAFGVPYDDSTKLLMKKICFNDEPHEDSEMLFSFVEVPELGEVVLKNGGKTVEDMNVQATGIAADRHNIPLTEGRYLTHPASHPNLIAESS